MTTYFVNIALGIVALRSVFLFVLILRERKKFFALVGTLAACDVVIVACVVRYFVKGGF